MRKCILPFYNICCLWFQIKSYIYALCVCKIFSKMEKRLKEMGMLQWYFHPIFFCFRKYFKNQANTLICDFCQLPWARLLYHLIILVVPSANRLCWTSFHNNYFKLFLNWQTLYNLTTMTSYYIFLNPCIN